MSGSRFLLTKMALVKPLLCRNLGLRYLRAYTVNFSRTPEPLPPALRESAGSEKTKGGPRSISSTYNSLTLCEDFVRIVLVGHIKLCAIRTRAEVDFSVMPFDDDPVADNQAESGA
jgi:hypothetical protein